MILNNKVYDVLKWVVVIALPALAVAYGAFGSTWGLTHVDQVVVTINVLATFLGALICVSTVNYNKNTKE